MSMEKFYKISESELRELIYDSMKLAALENGGVDNWDWYGVSISNFTKANGDSGESLYDIAAKELEAYPEV